MAQIKGIDISHWQTNIDWRVLDASIQFVIIKCSESVDYVDPTFAERRDKLRAMGMTAGYYHFARGGDPIAEADFFLLHAGDIREGEFLVLDWEIDHSNSVAWCKAFLERVKSRIGFPPFFYTYESRMKAYDWSEVSLGEYPLWIAKYGKNDGTVGSVAPFIGPWKNYALWQFTSCGSVAGIAGNVDVNVFNGDIGALRYLGKWPPNVANSLPQATGEANANSSNTPIEEDIMIPSFIQSVSRLCDKDYGERLNENEQADAGTILESRRKELEKLRAIAEAIPENEIREVIVQDPALIRELEATKKALQETEAKLKKATAAQSSVTSGTSASKAMSVSEAFSALLQALFSKK